MLGFIALILWYWGQHVGQAGCGWLIVIVITGIILTVTAGGIGIILLFVLLLLAIVILASKKPIAGWIVFLMLLASTFSCVAGMRTAFDYFSHKESIPFRNRIYNLALRTEGDMDCIDSTYILYKCDSLGLVCQAIYTSERYGECLGDTYNEFPQQISLEIESSDDALFLQFDGETVYTIQADGVMDDVQ